MSIHLRALRFPALALAVAAAALLFSAGDLGSDGADAHEGGTEGCTPGYWKQEQHFDSWPAPYDPDDAFSDHFEDVFPGMTMLDVLSQGGGGLNALGRHMVAALLNSAHPGVDYSFVEVEVIDWFDNTVPNTKDYYNFVKDKFEDENQLGCPLN